MAEGYKQNTLNNLVAQVLLMKGVLSKEQLKEAWDICQQGNGNLAQIICAKGWLTPEQMRSVIQHIKTQYSTTSTESSQIARINLGRQFGPYTIVKEIARGGMGVVFQVRENNSNRILAMKILLSEISANQDNIVRFFREAQSASSLNHPNIVKIHTMGQENGYHYFTMDYIEGTTFHDYMEGCSRREQIKILIKIAFALQSAHEKGIIHRDIKPSNIIINTEGEPYLMDFGLAKSAQSKNVTHTGTVLGTPFYMSPEQAEGNIREINHTSDIYSLGVILYECLTQRLPFEEETLHLLYSKIITCQPVFPSKLAKVPKQLEYICLKAMAKDKSNRYQYAKNMAKDLQDYLDNKNNKRFLQRHFLLRVSKTYEVHKEKIVTATIFLLCAIFSVLFLWPFIDGSYSEKKKAADLLQERKYSSTQKIYLKEIEELVLNRQFVVALAKLEQLEQQDSSSVKILKLKTEILKHQQNWADALSAISEAINISPSVDLYLERADIALKSGYTDEVPFDIEQAKQLSTSPQEKRDLQKIQADYFLQQNDYSSAFEIYQNLLEQQQNSPSIYLNIGKASFYLEKYQEALKYLERAEKSLETANFAHFYKGLVYNATKKHHKAITDFEQIITEENSLQSLALAHLGITYIKLEQFDSAVKYLQQAREKIPNNPLVREGLCEYYLQKQLPEKALEEVRFCIESVPWYSYYYYLYGQCLRQMKKFAEAENYFKKALELDPTQLTPLIPLILSQFDQGGLEKLINIPATYNCYTYRYFLEGEPQNLFRDLDNVLKHVFSTTDTTPQQNYQNFLRLLEKSDNANIQEIAISALASFYQNQDLLQTIQKHIEKYPISSDKHNLWKKLQDKIQAKMWDAEKKKIRRLSVQLILGRDVEAFKKFDELGERGEKLLRGILQNPTEGIQMRFIAARTLLSIANTTTFETVEKYSHSQDLEGALLCAVALKEKDFFVSEEILSQGLHHPNPFLRALCAKYTSSEKQLKSMLADNDERVRIYAASNLLSRKISRSLEEICQEVLARSCSSDNPFIRSYSCAKLWRRKAPQEKTPIPKNTIKKYKHLLIQGTQDSHPQVQRLSAARIASCRVHELTPYLVELTQSPETMVKYQALTSLGWLAKEVKIIESVLFDENQPNLMRSVCLATFAQNRYSGKVNFAKIKGLLEEKDPKTGIFTLCFIGNMGGVLTSIFIKPYMKHSNDQVRLAAVAGLFDCADESFIPEIEQLLQDSSKDVRNAAASAMIRIAIKGKNMNNVSVLHRQIKKQNEEIRKGAAFSYYFFVYQSVLNVIFTQSFDRANLQKYSILEHKDVVDFLYEDYFVPEFEKQISSPTDQKEFFLWCLNQAIDLAPDSKFYFERALISKHNKYWGQAITDIHNALQIAPNNELYLKYLVKIHMEAKQYDLAIKTCEDLAKINPRANTWHLKAKAYLATGLVSEAAQAYWQAYIINPRKLEYYSAMADCYWQAGQREQALSHYLRLYENITKSKGKDIFDASYLHITRLYMLQNKKQQALQFFLENYKKHKTSGSVLMKYPELYPLLSEPFVKKVLQK